jgi:hypothetical protein
VLDGVVEQVSKQPGHTTTAVTLAHYIDEDVLAKLRRLARSQRGPKGTETEAA